MTLDTGWMLRPDTSRQGIEQLFRRPVSERLWLARALADLEDELSLGWCTLLTQDPEPEVRAEVALGLGRVAYRSLLRRVAARADQITLQQLTQLAHDSAWEVRANVPCAALQVASESVMPIVHHLRYDKVDAVREIARECYEELAALHPNTAAKLLDDPHHTMLLATAAPTSLGRFWAPRRRAMGASLSPEFHVIDIDLSAAAPTAQTDFGAVETVGATDDSGGGGGDDGGDGGGSDDGGDGGGDDGGDDGGGGDQPAPYLDLGNGSRYLNSWFVGHDDPLKPLEYQREYELGIEVAPQPRIGSFTSDDPRFTEPQFEAAEAVELTVGIVSDDFAIVGKAARRMILPRDPSMRSQEISFKVVPQKSNQEVRIHVFVYQENNLIHEGLITARVQILARRTEQTATRQYKPFSRFSAPVQGPRDVNLQVIELAGAYRLVLFYDFGGTDFDILWCTVEANRDQIVTLLAAVRKDLVDVVNTQDAERRKIYFDGEPEQVPIAEQRLPNLFRIDDEAYRDTLQRLARAGSRLYVNLFDSAPAGSPAAQRAQEFGRRLRELSARQPLRMQVLSDEFFIPWNLLFDGEFPAGTIDTGQFWGFRHLIEEVPASSRTERIEPVIPVLDKSVPIALNVNVAAIPAVLTDPQRRSFREWGAGVDPIERLTEQEVLQALQGRQKQGEVEYFYCHAGVDGTSQSDFEKSYLGLTHSDQGLTLADIKIATIGRSFASKPVVFLNACESGRMDGRFYDGFVPKFLKMGARVVLGSDCEVPSLFGAHFGTQFMQALLKGEPVGAALLAQRKDLLTRYQNPLGLIYRVFGNAETRLSKPLI